MVSKNGAPAQEAQKGDAYKWLALLTVSIGTFMSTMDASIVNISFPTLTKVFNTGPSTVLWVTLSYLLVTTGLMLTLGRLGDLWGRKSVYASGFVVFSLGLALCSLAQTIEQLILFRVVQAIGAAMAVAVGTAIITAAFPSQERGKALGIMAAVVGAGLTSGPALGGFLVDTLGWRSIFYTRLPAAVIGSAMAWAVLREQTSVVTRRQFDFRGAVALFGGLSTLLLGINQGQQLGWDSIYILGLFVVSMALLGFFFITEMRVAHPVVDLSLFRSRIFAIANATLLLRFIPTMAVTFLMPFYLIQGVGRSSSAAGLLLTTVPLTMLLVSPLSGWLSDRIGSWLLCATGLFSICLSLFLLSSLDLGSTSSDVALALVLMGLGAGLFESPNNSSIMGSVPGERLGTASAMIATLRTIGQATGLAVAGAIFTSRRLFYEARLASDQLDPELLQAEALVGGFQDALLVALLICGVALLVSMARGRR